jgi:septation ring formation regulator EzrA
MDEDELAERIHRQVEEIHVLARESHDFMPLVVNTLESIGSLMRSVGEGVNTAIEGLRDLREEDRAQRQALLRMVDRIDRLDPGGSAAG